MEIEKLIEQLKKSADFEDYPVVASFAAIIEKKYLREAATAISTLKDENESLKEKLYDGEGVNLVDYWMQQAKIEENGHRNCQAENEKLRAELEQVKRERDSAILFAQCYTEKVENPCTVCRHRFSEAGVPLKKRCENCGLTGTLECGWEFDFDWDLKSEED